MIALTLQCWEGDIADAEQLTQLIADIEPERRSDVEFILSIRRGTEIKHAQTIINIAKEKFAVARILQCKGFATGWPASPNTMWLETQMRLSVLKRDGKIQANWALTFEPDCILLRPDWIALLQGDVNQANQLGKDVVGHAHYFVDQKNRMIDHGFHHINGNALFKIGILKKYSAFQRDGDPLVGWDAFHGELLLKIGMDTPNIYQMYRMREIDRKTLENIRKDGQIPSLFHGLKKSIGIPIIRSMIQDGTFYSRIFDKDPIHEHAEFNPHEHIDFHPQLCEGQGVAETVPASTSEEAPESGDPALGDRSSDPEG